MKWFVWYWLPWGYPYQIRTRYFPYTCVSNILIIRNMMKNIPNVVTGCVTSTSVSLQWRHNEHDGVSNYRSHDCLLNSLFRRWSKKTPKFRATGLCDGNSPVTVNSPHKGPVTRKMFPFDDVIMSRMGGITITLVYHVVKHSEGQYWLSSLAQFTKSLWAHYQNPVNIWVATI